MQAQSSRLGEKRIMQLSADDISASHNLEKLADFTFLSLA
jgi:hypothetical protein